MKISIYGGEAFPVYEIHKEGYTEIDMDKEALDYFLQEVEHIADGVGYGIEPFIKRPVAILMMAGFPTTASCEGHMDRALPYPWIDVDHLPQFPREIYKEETNKVWNDENAFKQLIESNHCSRKRLEKYLNQSGMSIKFRIEQYGMHHSIRLCAVALSLEEGQQVMSHFTEWLLNENASSN